LIMLSILGLALGLMVQTATSKPPTPSKAMLERGRHLVITSGCNVCHTAGYGDKAGQIPESQWLMGNTVGRHGPWGTTYPVNLRIVAHGLTEREWIRQLRTAQARPPMPWFVFRSMSDYDLASIYYFIRSLGPVGKPAPDYLPPGQKPNPPYLELVLPPALPPAATH
ncbi:MAG: c-type cytochrome, partial [Gammaproteobacteria bacterium]